MRKIAMIAASTVITALITVWSMYAISTTSPAKAELDSVFCTGR